MGNPEELNEYTVKIKVICTQTLKVKAKSEDEAFELVNGGDGESVTDFEWYEAYKQEDWEATQI